MRKSFLLTIVFAAACLLLCAQETRAQYAYGASGIGYDPNTKIVYGYSRTAVDYWAGAYYDPYVEGFLYDPYQLLDWGYSRGYEDLYDAYVETGAYSVPSTRYDVISDHYVISWYSVSVTVCDYYGFYGGCGYDPYGFGNYFGGGGGGGFGYFYGGYGGYVPERTYYLGSTGIAGVTPDDCGGSAASSAAMDGPPGEVNMAPVEGGGGDGEGTGGGGGAYDYEGSSETSRDYIELAGSSCALLPKIAVQSVGFKGDHEVKHFVNGDASDPVIAPGDAPTWVKGRDGNGDNVVAYTKGAAPTIFATLTVSGADPNATAQLRVKRGDAVLAEMPIDVTSNQTVSYDSIQLPAQLGETVTAREREFKFKWEVSVNGGAWKSAGESGDHKIYWLFADPHVTTQDPCHFRNIVNKCYVGLFDEALERSIGKLGDGVTTEVELIKKVTNGVANDLNYNPGRKSDTTNGGKHPLEVYDRSSRDFQCDDNAFLLRGLLRSAGSDGEVKYYYGGVQATERAHWYIPPGGQPAPPADAAYPSGESVTARFDRPLLQNLAGTENVPDKPFFSYHATVTAAGDSYDPSYGSLAGSQSQPVKIIQTVKTDGGCVNGTAADTGWKVITNHRPTSSNGTPFGRACGNTASTGGGTGIPRAGSVVAQSVPTYMEAGSSYLVSITMQNNGDNTWTAADQYRLGAQNPGDNFTWGMHRVDVPQSVEPGQQVTFDYYVTAPSSAGFYNFQWRMVQDGVEWFGDYTSNVQVEVFSPYNYCDPWQEQDCWNRGGSWDSTSCYCYGGWYNY